MIAFRRFKALSEYNRKRFPVFPILKKKKRKQEKRLRAVEFKRQALFISK